MMRLRLPLMAALVLVPQLARGASFTPLGNLGNQEDPTSYGVGLSGDGTVAVGFSTGAIGTEAFRWQGGAMTGLGGTPTYPYSEGWGVSGDGNVVVGALIDDEGNHEAFRWAGGVMTPLGFVDAADENSMAVGVSEPGGVVVGWSGQQAFRWEDGAMAGLGYLPGGTWSYANGVSADGAVVIGEAENGEGGFSAAFRWSNGVMSSLSEFPPDITHNYATAISADGAFVVGLMDHTSGSSEAFRWSEGEILGLGYLHDFGDGSHSTALAVSADGSVVVGRSVDGNESLQAFVWTETSGMRRLIDVLAARGATGFEGWELWDAEAISADGTRILGTGYNPNGFIESFIADISGVPEPSASWLIGCALAALACARHRLGA